MARVGPEFAGERTWLIANPRLSASVPIQPGGASPTLKQLPGNPRPPPAVSQT